MNMEKQVIFEPNCLFGKIPRWLELILQLMIFNLLIAIVVNLGLIDVTKTTEAKAIDNQGVLFYLLMSLFLILYLLARTRTFVNKIVIDYESLKISIRYSYFFFINKKCEIPFNEFSFISKDSSGFYQSFKKLKIYQTQNNKLNRKVTIISKANGWKTSLVKELEETLIVLINR